MSEGQSQSTICILYFQFLFLFDFFGGWRKNGEKTSGRVNQMKQTKRIVQLNRIGRLAGWFRTGRLMEMLPSALDWSKRLDPDTERERQRGSMPAGHSRWWGLEKSGGEADKYVSSLLYCSILSSTLSNRSHGRRHISETVLHKQRERRGGGL